MEWKLLARHARGASMCLVLMGIGMGCSSAHAQQATSAASSLVFDRVTVVDVEEGKLVPDQRVVIVGNRILVIGNTNAVKVPKDAKVVDALGKYLIPGLWDMHTHIQRAAPLLGPLFVASGVTGIRDAGSLVPLDTQMQWRREILAGTRVGPPRQILSGQYISEEGRNGASKPCQRSKQEGQETCVSSTPADARHLVDSLKRAGADMIKPYDLSRAMYFVLAGEAQRAGIPFGGHLEGPANVNPLEASDSGARIIDHGTSVVGTFCWGSDANLAQCQPVAERFRHNNTWGVPTAVLEGFLWGSVARLEVPHAQTILTSMRAHASEFWKGVPHPRNWLPRTVFTRDSIGALSIVQQAGFPILAGTDVMIQDGSAQTSRGMLPGFSLHAELAVYVAEGLTPLEALRTATLNPAKALRATDSLGTVAPGKLADLILLEADPLTDITNTTAIHAVVANGRYFDRAALDGLLSEVQAKTKTAVP